MIDDAVARIARLRDRPWLLLGKGPSLDLRCRFDLDAYYTLSLNHACKVHAATVAHFTDLEALHACEDDLVGTDPGITIPYVPDLVLPWVPHVSMGPGHLNLSELINVARDRPLTVASERDKLWSYNSTRVPRCRYHRHLREVHVRYFSAVAGFNLLVAAGHRKVYTLGIDGGTGYARGFDPRDRLANGRTSFDVQFNEIRKTCTRYGVLHVNLAEKAGQ